MLRDFANLFNNFCGFMQLDAPLRAYRRFLSKHHVAVLLVGLLISGLSYLQVRRIHIKNNLAALLPDSQPSVQNLHKVMDKIGGTGDLIAIIETKDFEAAKRFAATLRERLAKKDYIRYTDYRVDMGVFKKNALLYLDKSDLEQIRSQLRERIDYEKTVANPLFVDFSDEGPPPLDFSAYLEKYRGKKAEKGEGDGFHYFANKEHTMLLLVSYPAGVTSDIAFARRIYADMQQEISALTPAAFAPDMRIAVAGSFKNRIDEYESIVNDVQSGAFWSISLMFIAIALYFFYPFAFVLLLIPLACGLLWTFAITKTVIGDLNLITAFLFQILFGLGIEFGIHFFARYLEDRRRGISSDEAFDAMFQHTGKAVLGSAIATAMAFYCLMVTDFKGFSQFGFIAGTGILFTFVTMATMFPALVMLIERLRILKLPKERSNSIKFTKARFPMPKTILACGLGLMAFGIANLPNIEFEYDFGKLRAEVPGSQVNKNKVRQVFSSSRDPAVVYVENDTALPALISAFQQRMASDNTPTIAGFDSVLDVLPKEQEAKLGLVDEIKKMLADIDEETLGDDEKAKLAEVKPYLDVQQLQFSDMPPALQRKYRGEKISEGSLLFLHSSVPLNHGLQAIKFADDIREVKTPFGTYTPSSESVIFADMIRILTRDSKIAITMALIGVFLTVWLDFRRIKSTLFVMFPLICGVLWMFAMMAAWGLKLNIYNMVVLPTILGMAIDQSIHLYRRYQEEGEGSLRYIVMKSGGASAMCTLTTILGYFGMVTASHNGLKTIGVLAILGSIAILVATMSIMPAWLQVLEDLRAKRDKEPHGG